MPAIPADEVVDPTAAGDSFTGAFCTAAAAGISTGDALLFANAVGSLTVSKMGAQTSLPAIDEVLAFMEKRGLDTTPYRVLINK